MSRRSLNWVLLALLVLASVAAALTRWDASRPNARFLPEMVESVPYDSFARNPHFADGKTLQAPVAGTIARGWLPDPDASSNPLSGDDRSTLDRGRLLFARFCSPCHGLSGEGDGPVTKRGYPPPPSLFADSSLRLSDGEVFRVITNGTGNMPPHAAQISREDRWKVILHLRSLQTPRRSAQLNQPDTPG